MTAKKPTGLAARLAGKTQDIAKNPSARSIADRPPVTMPGQLGAFRIEAQRYQQQIQNLQEQLDDADQRPTQIDLPLDKLVTVEGRRRRLTAEEFAQLRENLRENACAAKFVELESALSRGMIFFVQRIAASQKARLQPGFCFLRWTIYFMTESYFSVSH